MKPNIILCDTYNIVIMTDAQENDMIHINVETNEKIFVNAMNNLIDVIGVIKKREDRIDARKKLIDKRNKRIDARKNLIDARNNRIDLTRDENETDGSKNENNPTNIEARKHIINIKYMNDMIDNSNITITAMNELINERQMNIEGRKYMSNLDKEQIEETENYIKAINCAIDSRESMILVQKKQIEASKNEREIASAKMKIASEERKIVSAKRKIVSNVNEIGIIKRVIKIRDTKNEIDEMDNFIDAYNIVSLERKEINNVMENKIDGMKNQIDVMKNKIDDIRNEIDEMKNEIDREFRVMCGDDYDSDY